MEGNIQFLETSVKTLPSLFDTMVGGNQKSRRKCHTSDVNVMRPGLPTQSGSSLAQVSGLFGVVCSLKSFEVNLLQMFLSGRFFKPLP